MNFAGQTYMKNMINSQQTYHQKQMRIDIKTMLKVVIMKYKKSLMHASFVIETMDIEEEMIKFHMAI